MPPNDDVDSVEGETAGFVGQFGAAMKKNFIQKAGDKCGCCLETCLPMIFVLGLIGIWSATNPENYSGEQMGISPKFATSYPPGSDGSMGNFLGNISKFICTRDGVPRQYFGDCATLEAASGQTVAKCVGTAQGFAFEWCSLFEPQYYLFPFFNDTIPRTIPNLDEMILLKWLARAWVPRPDRTARYNARAAVVHTGNLTFTPSSPQMTQFVNYLNTKYSMFKYVYGGTFASEGKMEEFTFQTENEGNNWASVQMFEASAANLNYKIRVNRTTAFTEAVTDQFYGGGAGSFEGDVNAKPGTWYLHNGYLTLQKELIEWYTTNVRSEPLPPTPIVSFMPFVAWRQEVFLQIAGGLMPLMIVLSFLYPVSQLAKRIVLEKENRIREAMMIMGMGTGSFYVSWFMTYALQFLITSLVCTFFMVISFTPKSNFGVIFFSFYLFSLSSIALSALMASILSKAKVAALVSPVAYFLLAMPMFAVDNASRGLHGLLLLLSPSAFSTVLSLLFKYEQASGMGAAEIVSGEDTVNALTAMFMLGIDTILYILLTLYFDAVLPSDWGTKRHPLFCFIEPYRYFTRKPQEIPEDSRDPNGAFEENTSSNPISVRVAGLTKIFEREGKEFRAVEGLHLNLMENEVNVLLGHNGAGKTTTMNMMTGMLDITKGDCTVYGKSVVTDKAAVHKLIGYCPQHNILWPELTCRQHLDFFGRIKGLTGKELDDQVEEYLVKVDLGDKMDYMSSALSGGQKRKLSVAIAFIGGSKLVFLDEPTAGMDVAARRHTWEVIKEQSVGRTILLTTHYMDEADLLGQTISIMSKGKLKCSGSSVFLKSRLGVGYALNMSVDPSKDMGPVEAMVTNEVPDAQPLPSGTGELAFRLPMAATEKFPMVLEGLENSGAEMGVRSYGITVTTLEEVFLKIADEEEMDVTASPPPGTPVPMDVDDGNGDDPAKHSPKSAEAVTVSREELWEAQSKQREIESTALMIQQFKVNIIKRLHNAKRDTRTQVLQLLVPVICVLLSMLFTLLTFISTKEMKIDPKMYSRFEINDQEFDIAGCNNILNTTVFASEQTVYDRSATVTSADQFDAFLFNTWDLHDKRRFNGIYCNDTAFSSLLGAPASVLYSNSSAYHAFPDVVNQYYMNYLRSNEARTSGVPTTTFTASVQPFPLTEREEAVFSSIRTILIGIIILIPFTFIPSTFVSWIVKEKETKAKHLQTSSGLNFFVYWFSNLVFDFLSFLITSFLVIIVFLIFNRDEYIGNGENFGATFLLFLLYGLAGIGASYAVSFAFEEHSTAQNIVMLSNFICGFLLVLVIFILENIESTEAAAKVLKYFFRIVPSYCLGEGIINLSTAELRDAFGSTASRFDMDVTGWPMLYMGLEVPIFMIITFAIDHPSRRMKQERLLHNPDAAPETIENEDPDVVAERTRVEGGDSSNDEDLVTVRGLSKRYSNGKLAVRNLSFGVHKGEVFGFLGTNGAGKTTTISILCGEQMPTTGKCYVVGSDVVADSLEAQKNIGYCPQFDALLELLTVKEHLELYSGIRGLDAHSTAVVVEGLMDVCGLMQYKNVKSSALSGGNKRKLSVAISLIGGPRVVFLDEPSAGMDPMARRGMWEVINHVSQQCAVVLTTHHLEEVEALADRVAIMVDGKMYCIGDKTHLKNKFGSGFEFMARIESEEYSHVFEQFIGERLPHATLDEKRGTRYTYALPHDTKLSETFRLVEDAKRSGQFGIGDYGISQTSLEQVFLRISEASEAAKRSEEAAQAQK